MTHALVWFRNDLRLADNPALHAALRADLVPVPVYIHAPEEEGDWAPGAASDTWRHRSLKALAADLERRTHGRYKVQIFPAGALGGERELIASAQNGSLDLVLTSTGPVGLFVPDTLLTDIPFLFRDYEHARKVLDGPIGQDILARFQSKGLIGLAWGENGFRHLTNSKRPVSKPEDLRGLKIRTMENPVHITAFKVLGAQAAPMSFTDLYTALKVGTIDGQENPLPTILASGFGPLQKYLSLTGHVYNASPFLLSKKFWDGLTDDEKAMMKKAAKEAQEIQRKLNDKEDTESIALLKTKGMEINELNPGEKEKILKSLQPVYDKYSEKLGKDLVNRLLAAAKAK